MKKTCLILLGLLLYIQPDTFCQAVVKHISEIPESLPQHFAADVEGMVLIDEKYPIPTKEYAQTDTALIYNGWPVTVPGESRRGGVCCNLDQDSDLEVIYYCGVWVHAWNIDGSAVPGWPVLLSYTPDGPPAIGDIDGNGEDEIVVSTRLPGTGNEGALYAFRKNGDPVPGFPVALLGGAVNAPVLADIDGDDDLEIVLEERFYPKGYVTVYHGDGTLANGWPQTLNQVPASAVAVGDITGDSIPEIIAESYTSIFAFTHDGQILPGFPYTPGNARIFSYSSPVLADLDNDGHREIIAGDHSSEYGYSLVHVLRSDGSLFPGWPTNTANWIFGPVSVADINYDGSPDIICGDQVITLTPNCHIYAWDKNGHFLDGFPTMYIFAINTQVTILNLDNDKYPELVCDDNTSAGKYLAFNHDGTPLAGWPVTVLGSTFFINPYFSDINGDGLLDFTGGGLETSIPQCNFYVWGLDTPFDTTKAFLSCFQYNNRHDGVYKAPDGFLFANFKADTTNIEPGGEVHFSDISLGDIVMREWAFEGGIPAFSNEPEPAVTYPESGLFDVRLTVSNGITTDTSLMAGYITVAVPSAIPDYLNEEQLDFRVYPNPAGQEIFLEFSEFSNEEVYIRISAPGGEMVFERKIVVDDRRTRIYINNESFASGIYIFTVESNRGRFTQKIIVYH
ncbi:MAG: VCBS repeat-containing protein [Bacteroidales bacterium]|nr:VCBS repeat-containing protein [Bacteroidales bacterium]